MRKKIILSIGLLLVTFCLKAQEDSIPQKYYDFVEKLDSSVNVGDPLFWHLSSNKKFFLESIKKHLNRPLNNYQEKALSETVDYILDLTPTKLIKNMGEEGFFENISLARNSKGEIRAIFRLLLSDGSLNYHSILLGELDERVMINDIYAFSLGEDYSKLMARLFLLQKNRKIAEQFVALKRAKMLIEKGQLQQGKAAFSMLPVTLQRKKIVLLSFLQSLMKREEEDAKKMYLKFLIKYKTLYPNDPSLLLNQVDYFFLIKAHKKGLKNIEKLQKKVNGDPYLEFFKATIYQEQGLYDKSVEIMKNLIEKNRYINLAYINIMLSYNSAKNYQKLLTYLLEYAEVNTIDPKEAIDATIFADFFSSQVWKDYENGQKKSTKD